MPGAVDIAAPASAEFGAELLYTAIVPPAPGMLLPGPGSVAAVVLTDTVWVCVGYVWLVTVTPSTPAICPITYVEPPLSVP